MSLTRREFLAASAIVFSAPLVSAAATPKRNINLGGASMAELYYPRGLI